MQKETLKELLEAHEARRSLILVTPLDGGAEELVTKDGLSSKHPYAKDLAESFSDGRSRVVEGENGEAFLQAFLPSPRLLIIGATHISQVLVRLCREVGIEPFVIDPRTAFATRKRFERVDIITQWPGEALDKLMIDARSAIVCLSHVPDIDDEALCASLGKDCFYIGALGSHRSHSKRVKRLMEKGYSKEDLSVIHGPAGLNIGSTGPGEIALSIIAEVVKSLRSHSGK